MSSSVSTKRQLVEFLEKVSSKIDQTTKTMTRLRESTEDKSVDDIKEKINVIRGGKSLDDPTVSQEFKDYIGKLSDDEKKALVSYLDAIAKVITGGDAEATTTPDKEGVKVVSNQKIKTIKPNVVKTMDASNGSTSKEDTSPPVETKKEEPSKVAPIVPKKR